MQHAMPPARDPVPALNRIERFVPSLFRPDVSHVIFDFDGTLSWLRHGWPGIMREWFLENGPAEWRGDARVRDEVLAEILSLNGKPSVHQAEAFSQRIRAAGLRALEPGFLLEGYSIRLRAAVADRARLVRDGAAPDAFVVHGARRTLELLRARGIQLVILSGTVEDEVRAEAELLGLSEFFGGHIYGSAPGRAFSKKDVIDRVLREEGIEGRHLLSFGDGPVEMRFTAEAGGLAIGVASDEEENGSHRCDLFKREQLVRAGAHAVVPDYAEADGLLAEVLGS